MCSYCPPYINQVPRANVAPRQRPNTGGDCISVRNKINDYARQVLVSQQKATAAACMIYLWTQFKKCSVMLIHT